MFLKHKIQTSRQILDQYHIIFIGDVKKHYANNNFNVFNKLKIIILFWLFLRDWSCVHLSKSFNSCKALLLYVFGKKSCVVP
jgi:hypothetical protein